MWFAIRLDAHWSKNEILEAYFTLAPFGGNIEGVEAATQAWYQKPPKELTYTEAALLVALLNRLKDVDQISFLMPPSKQRQKFSKQ